MKIPNSKFQIPNSCSKSGFGIIEALISSGIIAFFAAGIVILGSMTLRSVVVNKHRLQAAYLAQEAIEALKNIRDSNWVDENPATDWNNGLSNSRRGVFLDSATEEWEMTPEPDFFDLELDQNVPGSAYEPSKQIFIRRIWVTRYDNQPAPLKKTANVRVTVSWQDYGKDHDVTINSTLTDWAIY